MAANKGQKKILAILTALAGLLVALACFPQSVFEPDRPAQLKIDQLFVPALFNFEVGRDVEVSIEIKDQRGNPRPGVPIRLLSPVDSAALQTGITGPGGSFRTSLHLAGSIVSVRVEAGFLGMIGLLSLRGTMSARVDGALRQSETSNLPLLRRVSNG